MEIVVPRCCHSIPIVVRDRRSRTTMGIEWQHQGTTISIEGPHSVIIMLLYSIGKELNFHWRSLVNGLQWKIFFQFSLKVTSKWTSMKKYFFKFHWSQFSADLQWKIFFVVIEVQLLVTFNENWSSLLLGNNMVNFRTYRV